MRILRSSCVLAFVLIGSKYALAQTNAPAPIAINPVSAGQTSVTIQSPVLPPPPINVTLSLWKKSATSSLASKTAALDSSGKATIDFKDVLGSDTFEAGDQIKAQIDGTAIIGSTTVAAAAASTMQITISTPIEGDKSVVLAVDGTIPSNFSIHVQVFQDAELIIGKDCTPSSGTCTITPTNPLAADQTIVASWTANGTAQKAMATVQELGANWGRVRAYFTTGAAYAREVNVNATTPAAVTTSSYGSPDAYVGLHMDINVFTTQKCKAPKAPLALTMSIAQATGVLKGCKVEGATTIDDAHLRSSAQQGMLINAYADGELTQAAQSNGFTLSQSSNSAHIEFGIYNPYYFPWSTWKFEHQEQTLFIGPIAKLAFDTFRQTGSDLVAETGSVSPAAQAALLKDVDRTMAFGARLGQFTLSPNPSRAPYLRWYADFTYGRYDALWIPQYSDPTKIRFPWRLGVTIRYTVPYTPIFLGYQLIKGPGPDDSQFIVGIRTDLTSFLTKLIPTVQQ